MTGFDMKPLDELFGIKDTGSSSDFIEIPLKQIDSFPNHPYKVIDNEEMLQLADSIKSNGVINPAIVREKPDGRYELISGHRRKRACELAGLTTLKCAVKDISDDEATVYMVDSNFQRAKVLPSEKAFAYKMRLDAMKRQGKRSDLTCAPVEHKLGNTKSRDILSQQSGESREQIRRYIRLTDLIPHLLDLVDNEKIKLRPAVEISYISKELQNSLYEFIENNKIYPSQSQASELKALYQSNQLDESKIEDVMQKRKTTSRKKNEITIPYAAVKDYFPKDYSYEQIFEEIIRIIENNRR